MPDLMTIDFAAGTVTHGGATHALGTADGFAAVSRAWLRAGWDAKHVYSFSWLGRPIIQLPQDMVRLQEAVYAVKPDVILETGVAHGGSLVYSASLLKLIGKGRVIGVDIEIRPHNRKAIEAHDLSPMITLIEGSSVAPDVVEQVKALVKPGETVMVFLDSNHTKAHVLAELAAYAPLVPSGSYIVAMDGIMAQVAGGPRTQPDWGWNNPQEAALEFAAAHPEFAIGEPAWPFDESTTAGNVTYWPGAWLRRL